MNKQLIDLVLSIAENSYSFGYHLKNEKDNIGSISWQNEKGEKYQEMEISAEIYERVALIREAQNLAYYEPNLQQVMGIKNRIMFRNDKSIINRLNFKGE